MIVNIKTLVLLAILFLAASPRVCRGAEVMLSVAASMTDGIRAVAAAYAKEHPGVAIVPNFGGSGALAKQIVQGAPADLFISANTEWMEHLRREKAIAADSVRVLAANTLVFVGAAKSTVASLEGVATLSRIAIGSPRSVPAGRYAEQAMRATGIYEHLHRAKRLVLAENVRQALLYADRGEVDGAFVYKTDALLAEHAVILFTVPAHLHDRIDYPVALTVAGSKNEAARAFYRYLTSPAAFAILEPFGFAPPPDAPAGTN